jgi:hypothetical protein
MNSMVRKALVILPGLVLGLSLGCAGTTDSSTGPTITSFSPTNGVPGTFVTVSGSGFTGTTAVSICGVTVNYGSDYPDNSIVSDTKITFDVPSTVTTTGTLSVTNAGGTTTTSQLFNVTPTIGTNGISPTSGPVGTAVWISGNGLLGVTSVTFGSVAASIISSSTTATKLLVYVPDGLLAGSVTIALKNSYNNDSATANFTVTAS